MKLKYTFIINEVAGQKVAVPIDCPNGKQSIIKTNDTGAYILGLLKTETSKQEIITRVCADYEVASETELQVWVDNFIQKLEDAGVLCYE